MIAAPSFTTAPNADNASIDITLGALPPSATQVHIYKRTATGYDSLVHTFTAPGSYNDAGYSKYQVVWYQAVADNGPAPTDWSYPSREIQEQVGTGRRLTMGALILLAKDLFNNDPDLQALGYIPREYFIDPKHVTSMIYILPGEERPDLRYANKMVESEMDVQLEIVTTGGVGRTAWARNEDAVNRVIDLLHLNYQWGCRAYNTTINWVRRNDEAEGDQPQNPVTTISFTAITQYAKFI